MPNIRGFDAPQDIGLRPTEVGIDAVAGAARRAGAFYNQAADAQNQTGARVASTIRDVGDAVVKFEDHREISAGAKTGTALMANKLAEWENIKKTADPNDPSVGQKFLTENLEPALEQWKSGFNTENSQKYAEQFADQLRRDMFHKTAADMSTMAGIAVQQNARQTVNNLASGVSVDPSSLDSALKTVDHSIGSTVDSSPNLDAETGAKVKTQVVQEAKESIVKAAVASMITKNPDTDLSAIEKRYGEFLKPGEMQMFQKAAQTQAKVNTYYDKQTQIAAKQQADLQVHQAATKTITDNVSIDQNGKPFIKPQFFKDALEIARQNPDAPSAAATVRTMTDWGESQQNKEQKVSSDPIVASNLDARMFTSEDPTSKMEIMRAEADKKLSRQDAEIRMKIIDQRDKVPADPQFKFAMDGAKELIEGRTAGERSMQAGKYAAFMQDFLQTYQRQKAAGTLPPDALSLGNPNSLISKMMETYKSPLAAAISGNGGVGAPAPAKREDVMPAIPPADQRPNGLYATPKGTLRWTGTGWVKP